jgi:purine-binding chemotaxis protein CheW
VDAQQGDALKHLVARQCLIFIYQREGNMQTNQGQTMNSGGRELLTFTLGREEYGIDILKVQEIRGYEAVTTIANAPEFIKGVINLRGNIVPIVDMRIKFKLGNVTYDETTVVIVLTVANRVVGMVVDGVSDVTTLKPEEIKPAPEFGASLDTQYLLGLGTVDERMIILVDIERLMSSKDMELVEQAAA